MLELLKQSAERANQELGGKPGNWIAIATQFVQEKGYHFWESPGFPFNVGNIKGFQGKELVFLDFETLQAGVDGYVHFLTHDPAGYYEHVVQAIQEGTPEEVLQALSESKFCDPPYPLYELNSILDHLEMVFGLQEHNHPNYPNATAPKPTPTQTEPNGHEYVTVTRFPTKHSTLWGIALDALGNGNRWRDLAKINPGINPGRLYVGEKIRVK